MKGKRKSLRNYQSPEILKQRKILQENQRRTYEKDQHHSKEKDRKYRRQ